MLCLGKVSATAEQRSAEVSIPWAHRHLWRPQQWDLPIHTSTVCLCPQSLMLAKAKEEWEQEIVDKQSEKERYLSERITPLHTSGLSLSQLQVHPCPEDGPLQHRGHRSPPPCSAWP